eukprot:12910509-Prorocentrum_lima.AAC.1
MVVRVLCPVHLLLLETLVELSQPVRIPIDLLYGNLLRGLTFVAEYSFAAAVAWRAQMDFRLPFCLRPL